MQSDYDSALTWCRETLLFDGDKADGVTAITDLAEECCKALDGYDDEHKYNIPDVFFQAAEEAVREVNEHRDARKDNA